MKPFFAILMCFFLLPSIALSTPLTPELEYAYRDAMVFSFQDVKNDKGEFIFRVHLIDLDQDDALDSWSCMFYTLRKDYNDTLRCRFDGYLEHGLYYTDAIPFEGGATYLGNFEMHFQFLAQQIVDTCLQLYGDDFTNIRQQDYIPRPFFEMSQYDGEDYIERVLQRLQDLGISKGR